MKILVTGGAGFIGSHIVDAYLKRKHSVIVIDNFSTGRKENLNPKAKVYRGDLKHRAFVANVLRRERPDIINHHAALASIRGAQSRPWELIDANIVGTINLLLAAIAHPIKRFIFASSCSVLGHPRRVPANESAPTNPLSSYAFSKLLNEEMIRFYGSWQKFAYVMFRYPNVYGPRQRPDGEAGVIPIFGRQLQRGARPHVFGDGTKTRDYLYITDIVAANVAALNRGTNSLFHLGWGIQVSDQKIFNEVQSAVGSSVRPVYEPFRPWEARRVSLDARRARTTLRWKPTVALREGVRKTIASLSSYPTSSRSRRTR